MNLIRLSIIFAVSMTLLACGGSGSAEDSLSPPPAGTPPPTATPPPSGGNPPANQAPVANAGPDLTVFGGTNMRVAGAGADTHGSITSYQWQQLSGPTLALSETNTATLTFTAPAIAQDEIIELRLTVTDNAQATHSDDMLLTVKKLPTIGHIKGHAVNVQTGEPISGAEISANEISTASDVSGQFDLQNIPLRTGKIVVKARKLGFVTQYKAIDRKDLMQIERLDLSLTPIALDQSINPSVANNLATNDNSISVSLPANSLLRQDNTLPIGNVSVSLTFIDPKSSRDSMPGSFFASVDGSANNELLQSFGAFEIQAKDADGSELKLSTSIAFEAKAVTATTDLPPTTVPTYLLNSVQGIWEALNSPVTRSFSGVGASYQGLISDLGVINVDKPVGTVQLTGCFKDSNGIPIPSAVIRAHATSLISSTQTLTDVNGHWTATVPSPAVVTVSGNSGASLTQIVSVTTSGENASIPNCLIGSIPRVNFKLSWGNKPTFVNPVLLINSPTQGRVEVPKINEDTWSSFPFANTQQLDLWGMIPAKFAIKELVDGEYTFSAIFAGSVENRPVNEVMPYVMLEIDGITHEIRAPVTTFIDNARWEAFKIVVSNGNITMEKPNTWEDFSG